MADPLGDDALVDLVHVLAGLARELRPTGIVVATTVDVDPDLPFGPWHAVVEVVRAGVRALAPAAAGTLLERVAPVVEPLQGSLRAATEVAGPAGRRGAVDAAVAAAVEDAAALTGAVAADHPDLAFAVESALATVLAAAYATWVVRDLVDTSVAAAGTGLVDAALRPRAALTALTARAGAAAVLDVAGALPASRWGALARAAAERDDAEAMAAVHVRAAAALAGLGAAEVPAVAASAPPGVHPGTAHAAALVIGDAAVAAAATDTGAAPPQTCVLAATAWARASGPA